MFEELLDSAASAAAAEPSQSQGATPLKSLWLGSKSESSRTAAATGKAYRALKDLVGAARTRSCRAHNLTHPTSRPQKWCCTVALALPSRVHRWRSSAMTQS